VAGELQSFGLRAGVVPLVNERPATLKLIDYVLGGMTFQLHCFTLRQFALMTPAACRAKLELRAEPEAPTFPSLPRSSAGARKLENPGSRQQCVLFCAQLPKRGAGTGSVLTALLIVLLAVLWGAVFLPTILRARQTSSPISSVGTFRRGMKALGANKTSGRWIVMPPRPADDIAMRKRAIYRRRQVFTALLFAASVSLLLGLVPDLRWMLQVHLAIDAMLLAYVGILLRIKRRIVQSRPVISAPPAESFLEEEEEEEPEYLRAGQF
jgi:hypothetical protein